MLIARQPCSRNPRAGRAPAQAFDQRAGDSVPVVHDEGGLHSHQETDSENLLEQHDPKCAAGGRQTQRQAGPAEDARLVTPVRPKESDASGDNRGPSPVRGRTGTQQKITATDRHTMAMFASTRRPASSDCREQTSNAGQDRHNAEYHPDFSAESCGDGVIRQDAGRAVHGDVDAAVVQRAFDEKNGDDASARAEANFRATATVVRPSAAPPDPVSTIYGRYSTLLLSSDRSGTLLER
ncbi:hypothetical protein SAMN04515671_0954 [Nakamurella panacisegetis]|uniref:Uncharacterized protein n=1 Tax=Nakamurella panacisegetis TaxID=1090615 RepID=A0A1H0JL79_9ACTN|nr:hypothetical protein SAMN04515671_0954 [Nakamurella panacisegetis]